MLKINFPRGNILPKYFHLEANVLAFPFFFFFFLIIITHGRNGAGECRGRSFSPSKSLAILSNTTGNHLTFCRKRKKTVSLYLEPSHLSACNILPNKIKGPYQINPYWCINMVSAVCKHASRMWSLALSGT